MNLLSLVKSRFQPALAALVPDSARQRELLEMIRVAQDSKFGDYQANFAMPLKKDLDRPPRDIAAHVVAATTLDDLCHAPEIAGPGFINLRLREDWMAAQLARALADERLGIEPATRPRTIVIDYSSPNVAKPMHVGHIRSTVIGDALRRTLRFLGHQVISDNHLGDWGTQFGMIIYGYKHFLDAAAYRDNPVQELGRLYKLVSRLVDYYESRQALVEARRRLAQRHEELAAQRDAAQSPDKQVAKRAGDAIRKLTGQIAEQQEAIDVLSRKIAAVEADAALFAVAQAHADIADAVLAETAKLHAGDAENLRLWHEFLPNCRDEIRRVYGRLGVSFDYEYGESFYHDRLSGVVEDLRRKGLATESQGATCVFLDGFDAPMIVQKKDGAFLYSTTDLATIQYRMETWKPDAILYVVDHRQSDHFDKLFAAVRLWSYKDVELVHVKFGTVMGADGKPYKTREGTAEGLESLLDEAVSRALTIVSENDDAKPSGPELSAAERRQIAEIVGIGALKYADLSQNRTSDYTFSYDKMLLMNGNTATYLQYSHARVQSIFAKGGVSPADVRRDNGPIDLSHPAERALGLLLLRFGDALAEVEADYMPHHLTTYLFDLAKTYFTFYEECPVLKAETEGRKLSRLKLCDLTARTIRTGLDLLGIQAPQRM
jgi:arginyl-tRNA synthetase